MEIKYKYTCGFDSPEEKKNKLADDCYKNSLEGRHCLNTCRQIVIFVPNQKA